MSNRTREINKITTTIISISVKLIVYALIVLLLYEAVVRGYAFGHEIFYAEAVDDAPGTDMVVRIEEEEPVSEAADFLARRGLIKSEFAFIFQSKFYDYDTIYPGTYTLNTSMTSKEILQLLNEKPETVQDVKPAQSQGAKAASAETGEGSADDAAPASGQPAPAAASDSGAPAAADGEAGAGGNPASGGNPAAGGEAGAGGNPAAGGESAAGGELTEGVGSLSGGSAENQSVQANDRTYEGEDQEMEGGWIEDASEDVNQ